jgi:uncharacterized protein
MTIEQMVGLFLSLGLMLAGLIGSVVPAMPGTPLVLIGAVGHRLYFGDASASNTVLLVLVLLTLFSLVLDYIATIIAAKRFGATWRGVLGALLGGLAGLILLPFPGIIIGPFIGALLCEMLGGRAFHPSARAGFGAFLGLIVGALGKAGVCAVMMGIFAVSVITRSGAEIPSVVAINSPQPAVHADAARQ